VATGCKPLLNSDWTAIERLKTPSESLDAGDGSVFRIMIEVDYLYIPITADHDVLRLDIAVNDSGGVSGQQCARRLHGKFQNLI